METMEIAQTERFETVVHKPAFRAQRREGRETDQYTGCISELSADHVEQNFYTEVCARDATLDELLVHEDCELLIVGQYEPHCCLNESSVDEWFEAFSAAEDALEVSLGLYN